MVTNWHVVAGRDPDTGQPLDSQGAIPDSLTVFHNRSGQLGQWIEKSERLCDERGGRGWLEHPDFPHGAVDAVALRLTDLDEAECIGHDPWSSGTQALFGAGEHVNIIGFPFGLTGGGYCAIWIQGAVATEPALDFDGLPCFLVDARTRPGQSGSPVLVYRPPGSAYTTQSGGTVIAAAGTERLLGIYSGRINAQSDLGYVWKAEALKAIVERGI